MTINFDAIRADHPLIDVAGRYMDLRKRGANWWGLCPFHDDNKPTNFNIYTGKDGLQRYRCFACNESGDVLDFIQHIERLDVKQSAELLSDGVLPNVGEYVPPKKKPVEVDVWTTIVPAPDDAPRVDPTRVYNPVKCGYSNYTRLMKRLDEYKGEGGVLLFYVIRLEFADGTKLPIALTWCKGPNGRQEWAAKRMPPPYPIMGLDELAARPKDKVIVVSGEKCKMELGKLFPEYVVITWLGGDQAVTSTDWTPLAGRASVLLWPDADPSGNAAMNKLTKMIEKSGTGVSQ